MRDDATEFVAWKPGVQVEGRRLYREAGLAQLIA
jgi:hypothetical protein